MGIDLTPLEVARLTMLEVDEGEECGVLALYRKKKRVPPHSSEVIQQDHQEPRSQ